MSLSKSRKIMCIVLTLLIAAGSILFFGTAIVKSTVLSQKYMNYIFEKNNVNEQCEREFKDQIAVLEAQSGIPARVFDAVYKTNNISNSSAVTLLYNLEKPDLYSDNQIKQFESLCKEYLEGNNMQYDEELVHNAAVKAAQAYSNCFGLKNAEVLTDFIRTVNNNYIHFLSVGLVLVIIPIVLLLILYRRSREVMFNIFAAFAVSGMTFIATSIASIITKGKYTFNLSPAVYSQAFESGVLGACLISIALGAVLTAISIFANVKITKSLDSNK